MLEHYKQEGEVSIMLRFPAPPAVLTLTSLSNDSVGPFVGEENVGSVKFR